MKPIPQLSWLPFAAVAVLALLSAGPAQAGNRYDDRKVDAKYEARGDEDETKPAEEAPATDDAAPVMDPSADTPADTDSAAAVPEETPPSPAPEEPAPTPVELAPLPAPDAVSLVLSRAQEEGTHAPRDIATEYDTNVPTLYATITIRDARSYVLTGRIIAVAAEEVSPGTEVLAASGQEWIGEENRTAAVSFPMPTGLLTAGTYRLEIIEADGARRVIASAPFTARLAPLPPASQFKLLVHAQSEPPTDEAPGALPSRLTALYVTMETLVPTTLGARPRIVAEEVAGLARGRVMYEGEMVPSPVALSPELLRGTATMPLPRFGLPPGRYRLEMTECIPPYRALKSVTFTTRETWDDERFDLVDPECGGLLEAATSEGGAGLTWAWMLLRPANLKSWWPNEHGTQPVLPCELVMSFYKRELAMVSAVELIAEGGLSSPRAVEVWASMTSPTDGFQKVAEKRFAPDDTEYVVPVPSSLMRYVKVRFPAGTEDDENFGVKSVRVYEAQAAGYQPLRQRCPDLRDWRLQPRNAAQQGLYFLQASGVQFQKDNSCMGCHVQSQALMGLNVARKNDYVVSATAERRLADFTVGCSSPAGDIRRQLADDGNTGETTNTVFGALGLAYSHSTPESARSLVASATWLAARQDAEGFLPPDSGHPPVTDGEVLQTAHAMEVWATALSLGGDPALKQNLERALAWMIAAPAEKTQDKVFKVLAYCRHGGAAEKKLARQLCQVLLAEQGSEGAWTVDLANPEMKASPFATGQVLYALRQAGFSPSAPSFQRAVQWLLIQQRTDASWMGSDTTSPFASTMWPVIALTGSFSSKAEPAKINVTALARPAPPPPPPAPPAVVVAAKPVPKSILLVFDCSFSMTEKIKKRAKFDIAKEVLREVIGKLPDDTKVGLRLYGHRHGSMTSESRTDTQLVVPIGPLDRAKLLATINAAQALGQTPMVLSTLAAGEDLKKVGGGILIVVTDGEESCGGKPRKAGALLAELGVPLRLDVIGFALTGRRVVDEMTAFTAPTGGRFYTAADGLQLATALKEAVSPVPSAAPPPAPPPPPAPEPEDFAYEVFDAQGLSVAKSSTLSGEPPELAPGVYRLVLRDGAKTATLDKLKLSEGETLELRYDPATGAIERGL